MAYGITGEDNSTDICRKLAKKKKRKISDYIRFLVLEDNEREKMKGDNE